MEGLGPGSTLIIVLLLCGLGNASNIEEVFGHIHYEGVGALC